MARMGDVLAGNHSAWEFAADSVLIRFERGIRTPKLFQALGERRIPYEALSTVELLPGGKRGTVVLHVVPREGADPLLDAADGQLKPGSDPYRLVLPADRETLAEYYADQLREELGPESGKPADRHLVEPPKPPLSFKAYDGKAAFDGETVAFRWFSTGASSAKWKAGDQSFGVREIDGIEWRSPEVFDGHLRLHLPGTEPAAQPDQDPASVVFGLGYGPVYESLPFAAAVLAAAAAAGGPVTHELRPTTSPARGDPADIAERIRHLGELHEAGLLTDEEFTTKKTELLTLL